MKDEESESLRRMLGDANEENRRLVDENRRLRERCEHAERIIGNVPLGILLQDVADHVLSFFK